MSVASSRSVAPNHQSTEPAAPPAQKGNGLMAVLLGLATAVLLVATAAPVGVTWDEPVYITSAKSYVAWFPMLLHQPTQALTPEAIDKYWGPTHEHPPGERLVSGLTWLAVRGVVDEPTAVRVGPMLLAALLAAMLFHMVSGRYGRPAGLYAVLALLCMPRFFFHAHLAALDVPVTAVSFGVVFLFWQSKDREAWAWGLLWGFAWGLALTFKINAVLTPVALAVWSLFFLRTWSMAVRLLLMGVAALPVFFVAWPWIYFDTWPRLMEYVGFHLQHAPYGVWYFGRYLELAPWHYGVVMIAAVTPLFTLLLYAVGLTRARRGRQDSGLIWLLVLWGLVMIAPFIQDGSVVFDNDRFYMPAFVSLAGIAGIGFGWLTEVVNQLARRVSRPALTLPACVVMGIALLAPQTLSTLRLYPHLLSYYSEGVGGLRGATRLGFETTYWCETYVAALPYINTHAKAGDVIWAEPFSDGVLRYYQEIGELRSDVTVWQSPGFNATFPTDADWYIYQFRQSQTRGIPEEYYRPLVLLGEQTPVDELAYEGVPLISLYGPLK